MKRLSEYSIIFLSILLFSGCAPMRVGQMTSNYSQIPETTKLLDIPKYDVKHHFNGYPYVYWHFSKQKEKQLDLVSPEISNDSLIFRIWITNPIATKGQPHGLIEIKNDCSEWTAYVYAMFVSFDKNNLTETILKYEKTEVTPLKNDWDFIIDSLYQLNFDVLPTDDDIPNYFIDNHGYKNNMPTFSFEYATKEQYRFYQYNYFEHKTDEFWQARNVLKILELLDDEFNWDELWGNSLDSLAKDEIFFENRHKRVFYSYRVDVGAFIPLDNIKNAVGLSPSFGLYSGFPLSEKYRFDIGASLVFPLNTNELEYFLYDETSLTGKATFKGTMGLWVSRIDMLNKSWVIDNRIGTGLGFLTTDIPTNKPKEENHKNYGSETMFLCLGTGLRKGFVGLSLNYYYVPYNAFKKSFNIDFGSQYLTIGAYFTF